jgi:hypothetical protein
VNVVVSQPMYFPWVGMLEQIRLADYFVFYDDVQFSKGGFVNRVQIKTAAGIKWLTVPIHALSLGQRIQDVQIDGRKDWRRKHLEMLRQAYAGAPYIKDMLRLVKDAFDANPRSIGDLSRLSILILCDYFGLKNQRHFQDIQALGIPGSGSDRVLEIVLHLGGDTYITGHGARNYLNHEAFEHAGVAVRYMNYRCSPYQQLHGEFTPYVSSLDLVANCGVEGKKFIRSTTINWNEILNEPSRAI